MTIHQCFISWAPIKGASVAAHYEICNALSNEGVKVTLVGKGNGKPYWEKENFLVVPITPMAKPGPLANLAYKFNVLRYVATKPFDVINVFVDPGFSMYRAMMYYKDSKWVCHIRTSMIAGDWKGRLKNLLLHYELRWFRKYYHY